MIDFVADLLRSTDTVPQGNPDAVVASANLGEVLWSGSAYIESSIGAGYVQHAWLLIGTLAFAACLAAFVRLPARRDPRFAQRVGGIALASALAFATVGSLIGASLRNLHAQAHGVYAITPTRIVHFDPFEGRTDIPASAITHVRMKGEGKIVVTLSSQRTLEIEDRDDARLRAALGFLVGMRAGTATAIRLTSR